MNKKYTFWTIIGFGIQKDIFTFWAKFTCVCGTDWQINVLEKKFNAKIYE